MSSEKTHNLGDERRLRRLGSLLDAQGQRCQLPAERLEIELDGEVMDSFVPATIPHEVQVPGETLLVVLRDEFGTPRVTLMPGEDEAGRHSFDQGRVLVELAEDDAGDLLLSVQSTEVAVRLAASTENLADPASDDVSLRYTDDGRPEIDAEGFLVLEAFCALRFAGQAVVVSVAGLDPFEERLSPEAFLRVVNKTDQQPRLLREDEVHVRLG